MKKRLSTTVWLATMGLSLLLLLFPTVMYAQTGSGVITVEVCTDQNANGLCDDPADGPAPQDVTVCLNDQTNCQPAPATFNNLSPGSYTPFLRFTGASQGHYATTPRTAIDLAEGGQELVRLGAVYPVHPKGIAIHPGLNKVYVAFIGPVINTDNGREQPYPFVAVIDSETDEVLRTIPGGPDGIGRQPWGVAVSGDNVYVGSFGEGRVSVIDANDDIVTANLKPDDSFQPTAPAVSPCNGWVLFPDYRGGRVIIIDGTTIVAAPPVGISPFEIAVADAPTACHSFITLRDALQPDPYSLATLDNDTFEVSHPELIFPGDVSGPPHAIGLWQEPGMDEPSFFITYADDPRLTGETFPNPNKLAVYSFPVANPEEVVQREANLAVGDYAEAGLIFNPAGNQMLGTFAGFPYYDPVKDDVVTDDEMACASPERGGTYSVDFDGNVSAGFAPNIVVGNPPLVSGGLDWKNPFELAVHPNNGKVYVTDRCWNDFPLGGQPGGGAVLTFGSVPPNPGVTVSKSDSPDPVAAGKTLTYTLRVQNTGNVDLHATITDLLPAEVTPNAPVVWDNVFIPVGGFWEQTLQVTVNSDAAGPLLNQVEVTTEEGPADTDQETTQVANLRVIKSDSPDPVVAGETLTYTIRVENIGSADLHTRITDILPPGVTPNAPVVWDNIFIPVGGFWETVLVVTVDPDTAGPLLNRVEVTSEEGATGEVEITTEVVPPGKIIVNACPDQDADGSCGPGEPLPTGVQGCLRGDSSGDLGCQPVKAVFTGLDPDDTFTPFLQFTGESEGHYSTTRVEPIQVARGEEVEVTLGAVYPFHPKGAAVHQALNKVYVAFQGPKLEHDSPYPFVAVIDGESDAVLYTIPGGAGGIGRGPWGVAVSGDGRYVYVSSFGDGWISAIDPISDTVIANIRPAEGSFKPTVAVANPANSWVHFPDYQGGRMIALDGLNIVKDVRVHIAPLSFSPFEMVVAAAGSEGFSFITMRDALQPHRYKFALLNNSTLELNHQDIALAAGSTGTPHAIGLWPQPAPSEARLFITYAGDPRPTGEPFPNPDKLAIYGVPAAHPKDVVLRQANIAVGDYAETGLIFDPDNNQMLGAFAGFPYSDANGDVAACASPERGGTYTVDFEGNVSAGFAPTIVVGNPPLASAGLDWKNPFELAINPNNEKVYVTDRCWNDFPLGGQEGGAAVLIFSREPGNQLTTPAPTAEAQTMPARPADVTGDGLVNILDLSFVAGRYGSSDPAADMNGDGRVDLFDIAIVANNFTAQ